MLITEIQRFPNIDYISLFDISSYTWYHLTIERPNDGQPNGGKEKKMKNTYIGKPYKRGCEICRVIDCDIESGAALVYNRNTKAIEVIPYNLTIRLANQAAANEDEPRFEKDFKKACKKYEELIKAFQTA